MLHDLFHRLHLLERYRLLLPSDEIADEDWLLLLVHLLGILLEFGVVAQSCGQLKRRDGLRVPRMAYAILPPVELPIVGQESLIFRRERLSVHLHCILSDFLKSHSSDGRNFRSEIGFQQIFAESDTFEDLGSPVAPDGGDTHFCHDFEESLLHRLDIVGFCRLVILLNLMLCDQFIEHSECEIWTERRRAITQEQCRVHGLPDFARLHNQRCLHPLSHLNEIMMHSRDSEQ